MPIFNRKSSNGGRPSQFIILPLMSDSSRSDMAPAHEDADAVDRDAKIEQLLLTGLDHYFAAQYQQAINVWTRALFLDRSHARARAYIERARSAMSERQRQSEELLQHGVDAFRRGEGDEARRLLNAAIDGGAPSEEALAVLGRLDRLEPTAAPRAAIAVDRTAASVADATPATPTRLGRAAKLGALAAIAVGAAVYALWGQLGWSAVRSVPDADAPARTPVNVVRETALPLPRRDEAALAKARALAAAGHLHEALAALNGIRPTDLHRAEADRLRADIQRQLLAVTRLP